MKTSFKTSGLCLCVFAVLLCSGLTLRADVAPAFVGTFKVLGMDCKENGLYYFSDGQPKELTVYDSDISNGHYYRGPQQLGIYRKGPPDLEGKPTWQKVAEGVFPSNARNVLFLFVRKSGDVPYGLAALPMDASTAANRSMMVYNLSRVPVAGQFDKEVFQLAPMKSKKMDFSKSGSREDVVMLRLAVDVLGGWEVIYSKPFYEENGRRKWIFIVNAEDARSQVQIRQFVERLEKPPALAPAA